MSDYVQLLDYSAKDALPTGNPLKIIKGSDIDGELGAIAAAIASKYDSTDIATPAEAQAGILNTVVITPAALTSWGDNDAGAITDIQNLSDPGADRILYWDNGTTAVTWLTAGATLEIVGGVLDVQTGAGGGASSDIVLTAGNGLSGGGDLTANRQFDLDFNELAAVSPAGGDEFAFGDVGDANTVKKATFTTIEAALNHDALTGFIADEHVAHAGVSITAGEGLTGGGTIAATRTLDLDVAGLTEETGVDFDNDEMLFYDTTATAHRKIAPTDLFGAELGDGRWYLNSAHSITSSFAKIPFDTATYDELTRGTWATGTYTRGATAGRIMVMATIRVTSMNDDENVVFTIYKNGSVYARFQLYNDSDGDTPSISYNVASNVHLAATDTVEIWANTSGTSEALTTGSTYSYWSITELA